MTRYRDTVAPYWENALKGMTTFKDTTAVINIRELQFVAATTVQKDRLVFRIEILIRLIDIETVVLGQRCQ
jgi:hypothetical protein